MLNSHKSIDVHPRTLNLDEVTSPHHTLNYANRSSSPTLSSSSSVFRSSDEEELYASPVRDNLPQASSYLNSLGSGSIANAQTNQLYHKSPPMPSMSPVQITKVVRKNSRRTAPDSSAPSESSQTFPDLRQISSSNQIEFHNGPELKHENFPSSGEDEGIGRAVIPTSEKSFSSVVTSSASSLQRLTLSSNTSLRRSQSVKTSAESLKPPLPIVSSASETSGLSSSTIFSQSQNQTDQATLLRQPKGQSSSQSLSEKNLLISPSIPPRSARHTPNVSSPMIHQPRSPAARPIGFIAESTNNSTQELPLPVPSTHHDSSIGPQKLILEPGLPDEENKRTTPTTTGPAMTPIAPTSSDTPASTYLSSLENCTYNELKSLLSEKLIQLSQVQSQNAQLWTLVNKQRTMIFDLQKDLDSAVEQNEKYRAVISKQKQGLQSSSSLASQNSASTHLTKGAKEMPHSASSSQTNLKEVDSTAKCQMKDKPSSQSLNSITRTEHAEPRPRPSAEEKHRPPPIVLPRNVPDAQVNSSLTPSSLVTRVGDNAEPFTPAHNGPTSAASKSTFGYSDTTPRRSHSSVSTNMNGFPQNHTNMHFRSIHGLLAALQNHQNAPTTLFYLSTLKSFTRYG